jgi:hypothetical protein
MPTGNETISKQEIIDRFNSAVKAIIENTTNNPTDVLNLGIVTQNISLSTATSSNIQNKTLPSTTPESISNVVTNNIDESTTGIVRSLVDLMREYAKTYRFTVDNTGTRGTASVQRVGRFLSFPNSTLLSQVEADVLNALQNRNISTKDGAVDASDFENFLTDCRNIWSTRCNSSSLRSFNYSFCHSNHVNHVNHGSRGRR